MKKPGFLIGLLVAVFLTLPLAAILYLVHVVVGTPFPAFDLFDLSARVLPGGLIEFGKSSIVNVIRGLQLGPTDTSAKTIEQLMGAGMLVVLGVVISTVLFLALRNGIAASKDAVALRAATRRAGIIIAATFEIPMLLITFGVNFAATANPVVSLAWLALAYFSWGMLHGEVYNRLVTVAPESAAVPAKSAIQSPIAAGDSAVRVLNRRQFIVQLGGMAATVTIVGAGLGALLENGNRGSVSDGSANADPAATPEGLPNANALVVPAPGTRPEYTPLDKHYRIDISSSGAPRIDIANYRLPLTGLVENPTELSLDQIRGYPSMKQYITMSCISNPLAGDLIGTTLWTGVSMQKILEIVKPKAAAQFIKITCGDGFYETVALSKIQKDPRVMLAYEWDNVPLPPLHGAPLRIHIPDVYGMKQPKWITGMEFVAEDASGFWVDRNWDEAALVRATSVIDTVAVKSPVKVGDKTLIPVGGIAWAGARGVGKVEVKVDDGEWVEAKLRTPLSDKTWVIWRYDWPMQNGDHEFTVRCTEVNGTPQITRLEDTYPSGATGLHSVNQSI